jgi:hypothetical protein
MEVAHDNLTKTYEILTQKIALTRIESLGKEEKGSVIGWEYAPPKKGERYSVYLGERKVLRTSPVEEIKHTINAVMIKTANSIYKIQYLK